MNHSDSTPAPKQQEKQSMLDELESLSRMLEDDPDLEIDTPRRPIPDDIPVLKSFVDDVPVLSERFEVDEPVLTAPRTAAKHPEPEPEDFDLDLPELSEAIVSPPRPTEAATPAFHGRLDDSFLDNDPLEISSAVRQQRTAPAAPVLAAAAAAPAVMAVALPERPAPVVASNPAPVAAPAAAPNPAPPERPRPTPVTPSATPQAAAPHTAASVTQPLNRFQSAGKNENPFLPKSTLDKIRENHQAYDASAELRKLIQTNPLNKLSFDATPGSKEYQALRQKASQLVNEVIRANMPRLEAELRMKLEQEVDRMFKETRKK